MSVSFDVDARRAFARFEAIGPNVRQLLLQELTPLAASIAGEARAITEAHIHSYGKDPGAYLATIYGGVSEKGDRIVAFVRSGSPLAHLLENPQGVNLPARIIEAKIGDVMAFEGDAGMVFAREVHFPGAHVPPYPGIFPAFEAAVGEIEAALDRVARGAGAV